MPRTEPNLQFVQHGAHRVAVLGGNPHAPGTPLIFLHGIAGSVHFWPALLPSSVKQHRRWYSIGLPGHFPSGIRPGECAHDGGASDKVSPELFAEILAAVIRKLSQAQPVALIGYSTGGFAALNLAARAPELVATVVSVSGFSIGKWQGNLGWLQLLASRGSTGRRACATLWSWMTNHPALFRRLLLANARSKEPASPRTDAILSLVTRAAQQQDPTVLGKLFADIRQFDISPLLQNIRLPALIAGGNQDPVIPYEHTCDVAAAIQGAELLTFRNVGHLFFVECQSLFRQALEEWIDRHCELRARRRAA